MDGTLGFKLATQDSAVWSATGGLGNIPSVSYSYLEKKVNVQLQCSASTTTPEFEALGEDPINTYKFRLTHKCCCWDGCSGKNIIEEEKMLFFFILDSPPSPGTSTRSPIGPGTGIGGGAVFIIILLVVAFVYFVGFAAYFRFRHQRTGKELIANRTFWVALPTYAKYGVIYVYRRATGKGDTPYQSV
jgi:hypothetical protein